MKNNSRGGKPSKKRRKFRLLLDAAFAKCNQFPKLSKKANIAHVVYDYKMSRQASDDEVYQKAVEEKRFVLTINFDDFKKLVKKGQPGIIGIESQLANDEIDSLVSEFVTKNNPDDFIGKTKKLTKKY